MKAFCKIAGLLLFAVSSFAFAAAEFPGNLVPGELVKALTSSTVYSGLPDNFPTPTLPAGTSLYVLGSTDNTFQQQILLGTTQTGAELGVILKTAYEALGWVDVSRSTNSLELCHDAQGRMSFRMTTPYGAENRIMLNRLLPTPFGQEPMTCAEQLAYQNGGPAVTPYQVFLESVPVLQMPTSPDDPAPYPPIGIGSNSSSSSGYVYQTSRQSRVSIPDYSLVEFQEFISQQMTAAGWSLDGDFVGTKSASAVWFKTVPIPPRVPTSTVLVPTELALTAEVNLLNLRGNEYTVSLKVSTGQQSLPTGINGPEIGIRGIQGYVP